MRTSPATLAPLPGRAAGGGGAPVDAGGGEGFLDALRRRRDRIVSDPRFQRFASAFFLTRPIARARSRELFDLCAGFVYSQVLFACVASGLLRRLLERPQTSAELAAATEIAPERLERLVAAAASLGLLERRGGGRYGLGMSGAALLGNPGVEAMIRHHAALYADLCDPVALLRAPQSATRLGAFWGYARAEHPADLPAESVAAYTRLMGESQQFIAEIVLAAHDFRRHRRLLDVGGGNGTFALAAARAAPDLQVGVFDLPAVAAQARARFAEQGLAARASAWEGDFLRDPLPRGADLVTIVRVLHDHDDPAVRTLLAAVRQAMKPGDQLLIAEPMADSFGANPMADAYFGMYLMAMGSGRARSASELGELLHEAGFGSVRARRSHNPLLASVLVATPVKNY